MNSQEEFDKLIGGNKDNTPPVGEEVTPKVTPEDNALIEATKDVVIPDDEKDFFKENFEGLDSIESLKSKLAEFDKLKQSTADYDDIKNKLTSSQEEFSEYKNRNVYADEDLYRLSTLKEDKDKFADTTSLLYGKLTPENILKMDFLNKHPEYKDKPEELDRLVLSEYKVELREEKDEDGERIEANIQYNNDRKQLIKDKMTLKAETAKREMLSKFAEIEVAKPKVAKSEEEVRKEYDQKTDKLVSDWKQPFGVLKDEMTSFDFSTKYGENELPINVELTKEEQAELIKFSAELILNQGLEPTEENIASVKQIAINAYKAEHTDKIINTAVAYALQQSDEKWKAKVHNSKPDVNEDKVIVDEATKKQQAYDELMNIGR